MIHFAYFLCYSTVSTCLASISIMALKPLCVLICINISTVVVVVNCVFMFGFRALLILDDIWDSTVLKAFDIHCRILLTTRNRSLTDSVSGMYPMFYAHYTLTNLNKLNLL